MEKSISEILNAIPPNPPRSKLEPYYDLIRELRQRSKTYREIAKVLKDHVGLRVDHTTICDFVHLRARRARTQRHVEQLPPRTLTSSTEPHESEGDSPAPSITATASDGAAEVYARIEALKRRKPTSKPANPGFQYEEGAPLRLVSDPGKK
ncbi:MAG: hypothetical protein ABI693_32340 [Bryobacteraceae bacterium]